MEPGSDITRREAVRRISLLVGGAVSSSTVTALLSGCRAAAPVAAWEPRSLSVRQVEVLSVVVDHILPRTDTPGATDVGVPAFIDLLLTEIAEPDERARFLSGLDSLSEGAIGGFTALDEAAQVAVLERLDTEAVGARTGGDGPLPFFATLKEWTLAGYYTSEAGATRELQWLAVPGRWDADVSLGDVGRAWA